MDVVVVDVGCCDDDVDAGVCVDVVGVIVAAAIVAGAVVVVVVVARTHTRRSIRHVGEGRLVCACLDSPNDGVKRCHGTCIGTCGVALGMRACALAMA